jgi:hypothetical protein
MVNDKGVPAFLFIALTFAMSNSTKAVAQDQVNFKINFEMLIDCDQPKQIQNTQVHGVGSGHISADKTAVADIEISALTTNTLHFESRLGGKFQPAPGGSTMVQVANNNRIRMMWQLPTNEMIAIVAIKGQTCSAQLETKLRYGNRQYSLFDGANFYFCSKPRLLSASCQVN